MTKLNKMLKEFHETFNVERNVDLYKESAHTVSARLDGYLRQLSEEMQELHQALTAYVGVRMSQDQEMLNSLYSDEDFEVAEEIDLTKAARIQMLDALADIVYVSANIADKLGMDIDTALERVHLSNMAKLCREETVVDDNGVEFTKYVSDPKGAPAKWEADNPYGQPAGKIRKPDDWEAPDLSDLV